MGTTSYLVPAPPNHTPTLEDGDAFVLVPDKTSEDFVEVMIEDCSGWHNIMRWRDREQDFVHPEPSFFQKDVPVLFTWSAEQTFFVIGAQALTINDREWLPITGDQVSVGPGNARLVFVTNGGTDNLCDLLAAREASTLVIHNARSPHVKVRAFSIGGAVTIMDGADPVRTDIVLGTGDTLELVATRENVYSIVYSSNSEAFLGGQNFQYTNSDELGEVGAFYACDIENNSITIQLPRNPSIDDAMMAFDVSKVNPLGETILITRNADNPAYTIDGKDEDFLIDVKWGSVTFVYDGLQNWTILPDGIGSTGNPGDSGPQGTQGVTGAQGSPGVTGSQGPEGNSGPQGVLGDSGSQGSQGADGVVGPQGFIGLTGPQGGIGGTGAQGTQGNAGPQGAPSTVPGPQGGIGAPGPQGFQGQTGTGILIIGSDTIANILLITTASPGDMWIATNEDPAASPPGVAGDGYVWDSTAWNNVGPIRGPQGLQGPQGGTGAQGAASTVSGPQGATGAASTVPGPQGASGPQGATGAASTVPGPQGGNGAQGSQGATGAASTVPGPQGSAGPQGNAGQTGAQGSSGGPGPQGATGGDGPQGTQGFTGLNGPQGATGPQGAQGADGIDATPPTTGSFVPTINVSGVSGTFRYQKVGRVCTIVGIIKWTGAKAGSPAITVSGLPYTASVEIAFPISGMGVKWGAGLNTPANAHAMITSGSAMATLYKIGNEQNGVLRGQDLTATGNISFNFSYWVAA